jgi:hypothetical protein
MKGKGVSSHDALFIYPILFLLAVLVYFIYPGRFLNVRPWFIKRKVTPQAEAVPQTEGETTIAETISAEITPEGPPQA